MSENDRVILDNLLEGLAAAVDPNPGPARLFFNFVTNQALKSFDASDEDVDAGCVDGALDGGLDGFYSFVNGMLLREDSILPSRGPIAIDLILIQSKTATSFQTRPFEALNSSVESLFDLDQVLSRAVFNDLLIAATNRFRETYLTLAPYFPILRIRVIYASRGDTSGVNPLVNVGADALRSKLSSQFTSATIHVDLWGSTEILIESRKQRSSSLTVKFIDQPVSPQGDAFLGLVSLADYLSFVTDDSGSLVTQLFDSNVRDYQGDVEVNKEIKNTLSEQSNSPDFWWLNNGITMLASSAQIVGSRNLTVADVQIVNGLQTTYALHEVHATEVPPTDTRAILVKVIVTDDDAVRDRVIKATNYQSSIPAASLRATDKIHRDIEDYFRPKGFYYERRKNHYKNQGYRPDRLVSIPYLAQAVMAAVLQQPDFARARPTTLIKRTEDYGRVFDPSRPVTTYLGAVRLMKAVDAAVSTVAEQWRATARNLRFHIAMAWVAQVVGETPYTPDQVDAIEWDTLADTDIRGTLSLTLDLYDQYFDANHIWVDTASKSRDFVDYILEHLFDDE